MQKSLRDDDDDERLSEQVECPRVENESFQKVTKYLAIDCDSTRSAARKKNPEYAILFDTQKEIGDTKRTFQNEKLTNQDILRCRCMYFQVHDCKFTKKEEENSNSDKCEDQI